MNATENAAEIEKFADLVLDMARKQALKKLVFSKPSVPEVLRATAVLCTVRRALCLQVETLYRDGKAKHENLLLDTLDRAALAARLTAFGQVDLITPAGSCELRRNKKGHAVLLGADRLGAVSGTLPVGGNDRKKQYILTGEEPFLRRLGISDENGRIHDKKGPKFRQINRFLELIRDTVPALPKGEIRICDLCCGKSYLSFAVYHYFANILGYRVSMTGVDLKPDVIAYCADVARELGFTGLEFVCGDVRAYESPKKPELVISLHACDTATDLVLEKAEAWGARVILSTPCCHHALNRTLNCPALGFLAEHSMLRQKLCDAATDALRLKRLESKGYDVAALELIDPDDTPKNIMLRAIRRRDAGSGTPAEKKAAAEYAAAVAFLTGEAL